MDALTDFILHPSGAIAELYGLSDDMIRKYAHQTIRDNDICILYVDNARLIHDHELMVFQDSIPVCSIIQI